MKHLDPVLDSPCEHAFVWIAREQRLVCRLCLVRVAPKSPVFSAFHPEPGQLLPALVVPY